MRQLAVLGAKEVLDRELVREGEELRQRRDQRHRAGKRLRRRRKPSTSSA
jgi:hypothetical protein